MMRVLRQRLAATISAIGIFLTGVLGALPSPAEILRDNPDVRERFASSFGFQGPREPTVSRDEQTLLTRVRELLESENTAEAIRVLRAAIRPDSSGALPFTLGNILLQSGEWESAATQFRAALEKTPDFARAQQNLGFALIRFDLWEEAAKAFTQYLEIPGPNAAVYGLLGYAQSELGRDASAEYAFRHAVGLSPENRDWNQGLIQSLLRQGRYPEALSRAEEQLAQNPDSISYWQVVINARIGQSEWLEAIAALRSLTSIRPLAESETILLGELLQREGIQAEAWKVFQSAWERQPTVSLWNRVANLARQSARNGDSQPAATVLSWIPQIPEGEADAAMLSELHALISWEAGDLERAEVQFRSAVETSTAPSPIRLSLARLLEERGELEAALFQYQLVFTDSHFAPEAYLRSAQIALRQERWTQAEQWLEEAQSRRYQAQIERFLERVRTLARSSP